MQIYNPSRLLETLCALPHETGWVEFKENNFNPDTVGAYISSLANAAMFAGVDAAYLVFGVRDDDHVIVGTNVDLEAKKIGNEPFELWINKFLEPKINIGFKQFYHEGLAIAMICIDPAYQLPVRFKGTSYIRVGSAQQPLAKYPERERALWQITSRYSFESSFLTEHLSRNEIDDQFAYRPLLKAMGLGVDSADAAFEYMTKAEWIRSDLQGGYEVLALLAITCSTNLNRFPSLEDKGARLLAYRGRNKLDAIDDVEGRKGYLVSFQSLLAHVMSKIPSKEVQLQGARIKQYAIPEDAVRELLANMLVHQDFTVSGTRPMVEVFEDKVRMTNPGQPLISVDRFIDTPSKTRNPKFAKLMRDAGFCEQRGSGVDRAIKAIEKAALPPPLIEAIEGSTVVTLFMPRRFADMTPEERVRACFQHACVRYEDGEPMSNASLRERFGLSTKQYPQVSIVIRDTVTAGRIRPQSEDQGNRNARYVPFYVEV